MPQTVQGRGKVVRYVPYVVGILFLIILPHFLHSYYQSVAARILIYALFAVSLDILYGYTGLFSMGHAAFFGAGGYTVGLLMTRYGIDSFWIGAPVSMIMAGIVAAAFGVIALRVAGVYFLLVTFALGQLLVSLATRWDYLSTTPSSTDGILGIVYPNLGIGDVGWSNISYYYFVSACFVVCFAILQRFVNSPFGYSLQGIRESEARMRALGYNTWLHKYLAFIVGGMFAGLAGVLMAYHDGFIVPVYFGVLNSALALLMVIIGGVGTLFGPIFGAAFIIIVEQFASTVMPERWPLLLGVAFVLAVMFARGGIGVHIAKLYHQAWALWKR